MTDSKERFSSRVENYIKYRPGYPPAILEYLKTDCQLTPKSAIADVGSGTGILAELFLKNGNVVYGIEPNRDMREAGERLLRGYKRFHSIEGSAEATTLASGRLDFVTAGQAFHWFDPDQARAEFKRLLKAEGWVALVWNERREDTTPFLQAYEHLLKTYATDYSQVDHRRIDQQALCEFFGADDFQKRVMDNVQVFDYEALQGRLLSSSYAPEAEHPNYAPMIAELRDIFDKHQTDGTVAFEYDTNLYYGRIF